MPKKPKKPMKANAQLLKRKIIKAYKYQEEPLLLQLIWVLIEDFWVVIYVIMLAFIVHYIAQSLIDKL
jgi:hypothetical protein